jgi:hypothetical protein
MAFLATVEATGDAAGTDDACVLETLKVLVVVGGDSESHAALLSCSGLDQ